MCDEWRLVVGGSSIGEPTEQILLAHLSLSLSLAHLSLSLSLPAPVTEPMETTLATKLWLTRFKGYLQVTATPLTSRVTR